MTKVVVVGHGGYGSAVKRNMAMLVGVPEEFYFVDFNETDDLETLKTKLKDVVDEIGRNEQILFAAILRAVRPSVKRQCCVRKILGLQWWRV